MGVCADSGSCNWISGLFPHTHKVSADAFHLCIQQSSLMLYKYKLIISWAKIPHCCWELAKVNRHLLGFSKLCIIYIADNIFILVCSYDMVIDFVICMNYFLGTHTHLLGLCRKSDAILCGVSGRKMCCLQGIPLMGWLINVLTIFSLMNTIIHLHNH